MNKPLSTFERKIKNPKFKKAFEEGYKQLLFDEISRAINDVDSVTKAIQAGINAALLKHKQLGKPICVWRDGKVVWILPEDIKIKEE